MTVRRKGMQDEVGLHIGYQSNIAMTIFEARVLSHAASKPRRGRVAAFGFANVFWGPSLDGRDRLPASNG